MTNSKFTRRTSPHAMKRPALNTLSLGFWEARLNSDTSGALTDTATKLHSTRNYQGSPAEALTEAAGALSQQISRVPSPIEVLSYVAGVIDARTEAPF